MTDQTDTTTDPELHDVPTPGARRAHDETTPDDAPSNAPSTDDAGDADESAETFPREYVEKLRREAAEARVRAKRADALAEQLFHSRVAALGRLADPSDLPYDEALLDDTAALEAAVDQLVTTKPHLAARRPRGNIGQGPADPTATVDLAGLLRASAN